MAIQWDNSWNEQRKNTVKGGLERIEAMLIKAYVSVKAVRRDDEYHRSSYLNHFDDNDLTHLDTVTNIIKLMYDRVTNINQIITMSYVPDDAVFNALNVGSLPVGVTIHNVEAFVVHKGVAESVPLQIFIGPSFFTGNVYIPNSANQRTGTGTILHELSHGVGNTNDHAYTWDNTYTNLNANQRADNADSYRAYCQSFDNP
ncbi:MAG: M35 family metallo-endopeptidase [Bacteroidota bacterium]